MNSVERAQRDMLFALVMEASRERGWEDDVETIRSKYNLKIPGTLLSASLEPWEEQGILSVSRHSDGISAQVRKSKYGAALSTLMQLLGATTFEINWTKEEILHDSLQDADWPGLPGWKQYQLARDAKTEPSLAPSPAPVVNVHVQPHMTQNVTLSDPNAGSAKAAWFGGWGTWIAALVAAVGIVVTLWIAGKI